MANSVTDYNFKKFQNTTRTFNSEEQFNLGMNYTDSPIDPGQVKVLFNYDVANDEVSLIPRLGFKVTEAAISTGSSYTPKEQILSSVMEILYKDTPYKCATMFDYNTQKLSIGTIDKTKYVNDTTYTSIENQVAYIESTGTQYINTGIIPNQDTSIEIVFETNQDVSNGAWLFGSRTSDNSDLDRFGLFVSNLKSGNLWYQYKVAGATKVSNINMLGCFTKIKADKNTLYANDKVIETKESQIFNAVYPLYLLAMNSGAVIDPRTFKAKIYYCKIWQNGSLVRDFVPAIDGNDVVCLFDKISKTYFYNLGTERFIAGPKISVKAISDSLIKFWNMDLNNTSIVVCTSSQKNMAIHGINIPEYIYNRRQIGTKAWNNMYYFFGKDGSNAAALYNIKFDETSKKFVTNKVTPTQLTALEATPNKFNMLLTNPYNFPNSYVAGAFVLQGILPYSGNNLIVSPKINTKYTYKICYTAPKSAKYDIVWEWKDFAGTEWTKLKTQTVTLSDATPPTLSCDFASPIKESLIRVTVTGYTGDTKNTYPDQVSAISINCDSEVQKSAANSELKNYDLTTAKGMCYWQNRLVLWGFDDPIMFVSEANLPEWFPYPNNIDLFEEPIIHCEPYLDTLLVFTTQKLFQLSMLSDGSGWSKTCIQDHLQLTEFDTNFIKTIKNMVFFKSGNSYYMVVPSARTDAGLTIAPISKPIQWMLDNFKKAMSDIIADVYGYLHELTLVHCFNYINNSDIIINYILKEEENLYINFCLVYDTDNRTWRLQAFESQTMYTMCKLDATTDGTLANLTEIRKYENGNLIPAIAMQFITRDSTNFKDFYIPKNTIVSSEYSIQNAFDKVHKYLNYQYLDTGYRALGEVNTKKRHREIQLRINNKSKDLLQFGTSFYIDGDDRKNMYKYEIVHDLRENSKNYCVIDVVPVLQVDSQIFNQTILGDLEKDINSWVLDQSQFPDNPLNKIRITVSGKGYHSKFKLLSINEKDYELLGLCWVYKYKNLR